MIEGLSPFILMLCVNCIPPPHDVVVGERTEKEAAEVRGRTHKARHELMIRDMAWLARGECGRVPVGRRVLRERAGRGVLRPRREEGEGGGGEALGEGDGILGDFPFLSKASQISRAQETVIHSVPEAHLLNILEKNLKRNFLEKHQIYFLIKHQI
jgi:hypothetical protein